MPDVVDHGDDPFLFIGGNNTDDKVILDTSTEAYGMGGDDKFEVAPFYGSNKTGTVKIDGGPGSDTIYTTMAYEGTECFITGGGPERDNIAAGKGNDFIYVENDIVSDYGGENTFVVTGSGDDTIKVGAGDDVIIINKTSGSIEVKPYSTYRNRVWKSKRIIYQGDKLTTEGKIQSSGKVKLSGGYAHHDVLKMTKYHPISQSSSSPERMVVLLFSLFGHPAKYTKPKWYFDEIDDVADLLFENTRCTRNSAADPPVFCPEADQSQHIFYEQIERFELCKDCINLLLMTVDATSQINVTHEIIGGPLDDYVLNVMFNIPLMAQMGAGANRIFSGNASDSYSLILDERKDIIYDTGGQNMVAVMLPEGLSFSNVYIGANHDADGFLVGETRDDKTKNVRLEFRFRQESILSPNTVKFLFKERTGKEVVFKNLQKPSGRPWRSTYSDGDTPAVQEFYSAFFREPDSGFVRDFVESATRANK